MPKVNVVILCRFRYTTRRYLKVTSLQDNFFTPVQRGKLITSLSGMFSLYRTVDFYRLCVIGLYMLTVERPTEMARRKTFLSSLHKRLYSNVIIMYFSQYCDWQVCLLVCLVVCPLSLHNSKTTRPKFTKLFMHIAHARGLVHLMTAL